MLRLLLMIVFLCFTHAMGMNDEIILREKFESIKKKESLTPSDIQAILDLAQQLDEWEYVEQIYLYDVYTSSRPWESFLNLAKFYCLRGDIERAKIALDNAQNNACLNKATIGFSKTKRFRQVKNDLRNLKNQSISYKKIKFN